MLLQHSAQPTTILQATIDDNICFFAKIILAIASIARFYAEEFVALLKALD